MRRQFLGNLGSHARDDLCMKGLAQIAQHFRRSDDDKLFETIGVGMAIERISKLARKSLLGEVVPVGFFHGAPCHTDTCIGSPGTIGALLARRRIVALQNLLDDKLDQMRGAYIAQEKRLLTS